MRPVVDVGIPTLSWNSVGRALPPSSPACLSPEQPHLLVFLIPSSLFPPPPGLPGVPSNLRAAKTRSRSFMAAGMLGEQVEVMAAGPFIGST